MLAVEVRAARSAAAGDVRRLVGAVEARDGAPPLSDQPCSSWATPDAGLVHVAAHDGDRPDRVRASSTADVGRGRRRLGTRATRCSPRWSEHAAGELLVWSHGQRSPVGPAAEARGYARRPRAVAVAPSTRRYCPTAPLPEGVTVRAVRRRVGTKTRGSRVNAAAFAEHAEQGRWTRDDIEAREAEPWFDPAGFLLAERIGRKLLGFHWTKVHPDRIGEVYVLGVAPAAQGMRLGPALLTAGLEHLRRARLSTRSCSTSTRATPAHAAVRARSASSATTSTSSTGVASASTPDHGGPRSPAEPSDSFTWRTTPRLATVTSAASRSPLVHLDHADTPPAPP